MNSIKKQNKIVFRMVKSNGYHKKLQSIEKTRSNKYGYSKINRYISYMYEYYFYYYDIYWE